MLIPLIGAYAFFSLTGFTDANILTRLVTNRTNEA